MINKYVDASHEFNKTKIRINSTPKLVHIALNHCIFRTFICSRVVL